MTAVIIIASIFMYFAVLAYHLGWKLSQIPEKPVPFVYNYYYTEAAMQWRADNSDKELNAYLQSIFWFVYYPLIFPFFYIFHRGADSSRQLHKKIDLKLKQLERINILIAEAEKEFDRPL